MACECRDSENKLLDRCLGVCSTAKIIIKENERKINIENKIDLMQADVHRQISTILPVIREVIKGEWKSGFKEGIKFAIENDLSGNDY